MKRHIPNIITLCNQFCGILACLEVLDNNYMAALGFVLLGALFDFFDGFAARLLKVQSPMGKEMDSLADCITFGLAPGLLAYRLLAQFAGISPWLPYLGLLITLFSSLRLAKFNVDVRQTTSFIGLATPANAIFWFGFAVGYQPLLQNWEAAPWFVLALVALSSCLLVSPLPMFSLKFRSLRWSDNRSRYVFAVGVVLLGSLFRLQSLTLIIIWYTALSLLIYLFSLRK